MRKLSVAALTLGAVSGCAIGPSTRVESPAPASARAPDSLTSPAARRFLDSLVAARTVMPGLLGIRPIALDTASDRPWLQLLGDSTLAGLVDSAMAHNRELKAAVARVREYRALLGAARGDFFPQISINGVGSHNETIFGTFASQNFDLVRVTGDVAWELDFWGRLRRQSQAAGFDLAGREEEERGAVVTLVSDVVTAYLGLRELDQQLAISEQTMESRRTTLGLARRRFAQGVISELDVREFEAEAAGSAARVAEFGRQRAEAEHRLSLLLGQRPGAIPRGKPLESTVQAVAVPDSIPVELLLRRPDVRKAEHDLQAASARIGLAMGNRLPKVMLTGQYGRQRKDFHDLFGPDAEIDYAQAGISLPLFTGGKLLNQQRAARARADQARAHYEQAVLVAMSDAEDALVGIRLTKDQLAAQESQAEALGRAFALAQRRYESGVSSYLEVLESQRSYFAAQLGLVSLQRQYLGQSVRLYKALGGGWTQ